MKPTNTRILHFLKTKFLSKRKKQYLISFLLLLPHIGTAQTSEVPWLEGSWGVRLMVKAGSALNK